MFVIDVRGDPPLDEAGFNRDDGFAGTVELLGATGEGALKELVLGGTLLSDGLEEEN